MESKPIKINAQVFWTRWTHEFNTAFNPDNDKYEFTLGALSDAAAADLVGLGIKIKTRDTDQGKYVVGKSKFPFEFFDADGNLIDPKRVGNGTKVSVLVGSYEHRLTSKHGRAPSIKTRVLVTELKEYVPAGELAVAETADDVL